MQLEKIVDLSFCSILLDEFESRPITNRADINSLVTTLIQQNVVSKSSIISMREWAKNYSNENVDIQNNLSSCTYMPLEDKIQLHSQQIQSNEIKIFNDDRTDDNNIL